MECIFCKRNENQILEVFRPILENFESQVSRYDYEKKTIMENFKKEFSKENKEKLENIDENILKMKINALMDNLDPFLSMNKNLKILSDYYKKYDPSISKSGTIKDLKTLYINEPKEMRITQAIAPIFNNKKNY